MSPDVLFFVLAGVLIIAGAVLRELEVPVLGSIGRGKRGWLLTAAIAVTTVGATAFTLQRLIEMAL